MQALRCNLLIRNHVLCSEPEGSFFVPSPAIRVAEQAELDRAFDRAIETHFEKGG
jgi:hypothetical protein